MEGRGPKTTKFCETSSMFEVGNIKNEAILRDFFSKMENLVQSRWPRTNAFSDLLAPTYCFATKKWGHAVRTCLTGANLKVWCSRLHICNPSEEISALSSYHLWWRCLLDCACHAACIFAEFLQLWHACRGFWKCTKRRLNVQKRSERGVFFLVLYIFTSKCASHSDGLKIFDISTSKSGPNMWCLRHLLFDPPEPRNIGKT